MANITITNVDNASVEIEGGKFRDDTLRFDGTDTFVEGTILARRAVQSAVTVAADGGNTGDGTVDQASVVEGPIVPLVGAYNLECIEAVANGGIFKLEDPNGALVMTELVMAAGAGAATTFEVGGLTFRITDGATDFAVGDKFSLTVAADGSLVIYAKAGSRGDQFPVAVLTYEVTKTGAGTEPIRAMVAGCVNKNRLVIDADGDDSNVDDAVIDQLRSHGIVAIDVAQLAQQDNQ